MKQYFYELLDHHILNLNRKFRDKFSIRQSLYDDIILVLRDGWGDSQFKFWVHKNFKLVKVDNKNIVHEVQSNHPVVTYENLYVKIKECHEKVNHRGRDKTWIEVKKHYAWIPIDTVKLFISVCDICSTRKPLSKPNTGKFIVTHQYLTRLQIDLIDMQNMPDQEYKWILYITDYFTQFSWAYPLKFNQLESITKKLLQQFYLFGVPQILQSIHGKEFVVKVIKNLKKSWTDLIFINGRIPSPSYINDLARNSNNQTFKSTLYKWMQSNERNDWSNGLLEVIYSMNTSTATLLNNKSPYEIVFNQKSNYNIEICQILLEKNCLDEENLPHMFIDELQKNRASDNVIPHINHSNHDSLSSSNPSNNIPQEIPFSSSPIISDRGQCHVSTTTTTASDPVRKKRRFTSISNHEFVPLFKSDELSNNNNITSTNNQQQVQSIQTTTDELTTYMTDIAKRQRLFNNAFYEHQYKIGDLVGLIIEKLDTTNITLQILACKIISAQLLAHNIYAYQLCTKTSVISTKFQAFDLLDLSNCNFCDLHSVDPQTLPTMTFDETCKNLY